MMDYLLICDETRLYVHVAGYSSSGLRGVSDPFAVSAFCIAHSGKELKCLYSDDWTNRPPVLGFDRSDYAEWGKDVDMHAAFFALQGYELLIKR